MPEWSIGAVSKTVVRRKVDRGFESLSLRKKIAPVGAFYLYGITSLSATLPAPLPVVGQVLLKREEMLFLKHIKNIIEHFSLINWELTPFSLRRRVGDEAAKGCGFPPLTSQKTTLRLQH
jgi:hypothetical protein